MLRTTQLPPITYSNFINHSLLKLYHSRDFPMRLRLFNKLEKMLGVKRYQVNSPLGFLVAIDREDLIQRSILETGYWEKGLSDTLKQELGPEDIFFDIGCNIGYHSLSALAFGVKSVVAFDPDPLNCSVFELNLSLNKWSNKQCKILQCGISDHIGKVRFYRSDTSNTGRSGFHPRDVVNSFEVNTVTLDYLIEQNSVPIPTVLKIDVEGWERYVFAGSSKLLSRTPPRCIIFEHNPGEQENKDKIWSILQNAGYTISPVEEPDGAEPNNFLAKHKQ